MRRKQMGIKSFPKIAVWMFILAIALLPIGSAAASVQTQSGPYEVDVTLSANPNPAYIGQSVEFTATVTPRDSAAGIPAGTLEIRSGDERICNLTLDGSGQASCSLTYDTPSLLYFQAFYLGSNPILPGASSRLTLVIMNKHTPQVQVIQDDPDPSILNRAVFANVRVSSLGPSALGNLTIYRSDETCLSPSASGAVDFCTTTLDNNAEGGCTLPLTQAGSVSICAAYEGDYAHFAAVSNPEPHRVSESNTFTSITSITPEPSVAGDLLLVQFSVTSPDGVPSEGLVQVSGPDGSCSATAAVGECSLRVYQPHNQPIYASYQGEWSANQLELQPSSSDAVLHRVNAAPTDILLDTNKIDAYRGANTRAATLQAVDPNPDETHTFALVAGVGALHNAYLWINGNQLMAYGNLPSGLSMLSFRVRATDSAGLSYEKALTMQVIDNSPILPETGFPAGQVTRLSVQTNPYQSAGMQLSIPKLGISIPIVGIPYENDGWDSDWLARQAGWLNGTAFPGWQGNSVLAGHNYLADGTAGPFIALDQLQWGDTITVTAFGSTSIYEVRSVKRVKPDDLSVLSHQEEAWLTLITCKSFNEQTQTYRWRIAVQAVLVAVK
jgi:LPXTG-site transpeptidase (sortase) family protein